MLIFSTCKPFNGIYDTIQRNAIGSWECLGAEILLFGNEAAEAGYAAVPAKRNRWGTPILNYMVKTAESQEDVLAYANADIVLLPGFVETIESITHGEFLLIGQRINVPLLPVIDFSCDWPLGLGRLEGSLEPPCGIDYFVFTRGLWEDMPDLAVGRFAWDQALVYHALQRGIPVVDATRAIGALHPRHPVTAQRDDPECQLNLKLSKEWVPGWDPWRGWVSQATERL